jgi:molybdate transport system permease protein
MDLYPLWNSLRIAGISTVIIFFVGIFAAYYIAKLPRVIKGILDVFLTLPLVLPPTVVGYLLLSVLGPKRVIGAWFLEVFGVKLVMTWWSAIFATIIVIFPLMYRTARGAFESFDETLAYSGRSIGLSNSYIFWRIRLPYCKQGILAGTVLAFARALGEYGATSMIAGYTPGRTATISTTVYQMWRTDNDELAFKWVLLNLAISFVVLLAVNMLEKREKRTRRSAA